MKLSDFTLYEKCLEFATQFELEELSKVQEIEDSFVKFLKYIEILSQTDVKKVQGQKLISIIFSIDRFKGYQNVSLQLFDQNSLLVYEDEEHAATSEGAVNGVQKVNQIYKSARGSSMVAKEEHSIPSLLDALN